MTTRSLELILKRSNGFFDLKGRKLKVEEISFEYIPTAIFGRTENQDTPEILYTLAPKNSNAYNFNSNARINKRMGILPDHMGSPRYCESYLVGFYNVLYRRN